MKTKKISILDEIKEGFQITKAKEGKRKKRETIEHIYKIVIFLVAFSFYALIVHWLLSFWPREINIFSSIAFSFTNVWFVYLVLHFSGINTD